MTDCLHCGEPLGAGETVLGELDTPLVIRPSVPGMHPECGLRQVIGSLAHVDRRCSCFVRGSSASDPPEMSHREAARAAVLAYYRTHRPCLS